MYLTICVCFVYFPKIEKSIFNDFFQIAYTEIGQRQRFSKMMHDGSGKWTGKFECSNCYQDYEKKVTSSDDKRACPQCGTKNKCYDVVQY